MDYNRTVEGVSRRGDFSEAIQRAIQKLPPDVVFNIGGCRWKNGMLRVTLGYGVIVYGATGAPAAADDENWDE